MKVKYEFSDGTKITVEASEVIGETIIELEKAEHANDEKERYHRAYSIDEFSFDGVDISSIEIDPSRITERNENKRHIYECLDRLSETQRRRIMMLADGMSMREIARLEGKDIKTIRLSIEAARKKFLKNF